MTKSFTKIALTASTLLALAFTFSCSSDDGGSSGSGNGGTSSLSSSGGGGSSGRSSSSVGVPVQLAPCVQGEVTIGTQIWQKCNLDVEPTGENGADTRSACYDNDPANCAIYGRLYSWGTAMALSKCNTTSCSDQIKPKHQGICPSGWHIPSNEDWNVLMKFVNPGCSNNNHCAGAGTKLKSKTGWNTDRNYIVGTDDLGFSALPGGLGNSVGTFDGVGDIGYWLSANENSSNDAYIRYMSKSNEVVYFVYDFKYYLRSVRCLKD